MCQEDGLSPEFPEALRRNGNSTSTVECGDRVIGVIVILLGLPLYYLFRARWKDHAKT